MNILRLQLFAVLMFAVLSAQAQKLTIAAAADLRFAMDEIVAQFRAAQGAESIDVIYGSSGKFHAQILNGAPYDLYFSADIAYAQQLVDAGQAASKVMPYATGRLVLWSPIMDASKMTLQSLADPKIARIAMANPQHAPYGKRAEQALRASKLWDKVEPKLVYGENIAQAAQFVQSGNAQVGIIALALALSPTLAERGGYHLIDAQLHEPLLQGFIVTKRASENANAWKFVDHMNSNAARATLIRHGFSVPGVGAGR